jgi:hypothetical protein
LESIPELLKSLIIQPLYTKSHKEGERGGAELTIEKVRGATVHKAGSKITTRLTVSPVYKL